MLTLNGTTIVSSRASIGGVISSSGGSILFTRSFATDSYAATYAGFMFSTGAFMTVSESTISHSTADMGGGMGVFGAGGGVTITHSVISHSLVVNTAGQGA